MRIQAKTRDVALTTPYSIAVSHPSFLHLFEPKLTDKLEMSSEQRKLPSICLSSLAILTVLDLCRALRTAAASFPLCKVLT